MQKPSFELQQDLRSDRAAAFELHGKNSDLGLPHELADALLVLRQRLVVQAFSGGVEGAGVVVFFADVESEVDRVGAVG